MKEAVRKTEEITFDTFPAPIEKVAEYTKRYSRDVQVKGHYATKAFFKLLVFLAGRLSWKSAYRIGTMLGRLLYRFKVRRDVAMINLDIVYQDRKDHAEKERIYRECLINFGRFIINYLRLPFMEQAFWENHCEWKNENIFIEAMSRKKGAILVCGHIGMIDLAGGKVGMSGYPVAAIARRIKNPAADEFVLHSRICMNFGSIRHRNSMKRILKGIKRGEGIVIAIDQDVKPYAGVFINWLGRIASTVHAGAYLARKTGAPVIAGYFYQKSHDKFELIFTEEVPWEPYSDDPKREILINVQKQADAIQKIIYKHPELWFWIHRRYKTQPEGTPNPYKLGSSPKKLERS
jgi:Kdo2-lipid IVA lauroyltransferase/acyltransferase